MAEAKKATKAKTIKKVKETVKSPAEATPKKTVKPPVVSDKKPTETKASKVKSKPVVPVVIDQAETEKETPDKGLAKAGKRSAKSLKAVEEKAAKEERKAKAALAESDETAKVNKLTNKPARSRLERRGKKFREVAKLIEKDKVYPLSDALELAVKTNPAKFDASVELHVNLNVDPRQSDQNVRDTLVLPAGTGKTVRIAVFTDDKVAGADVSGVEPIIEMLEKGRLDFDVLISTPANMPKLGKYARVLGPRGLMPNPKSGTVTTDVSKALNEARAGRVEYRVDSTGIIHLGIGKVSAGKDNLLKNAEAVIASIRSNKPASVKNVYIKAVHVTTTMGPSIRTSIE
jgi:large subunit ribosomal protein L1